MLVSFTAPVVFKASLMLLFIVQVSCVRKLEILESPYFVISSQKHLDCHTPPSALMLLIAVYTGEPTPMPIKCALTYEMSSYFHK